MKLIKFLKLFKFKFEFLFSFFVIFRDDHNNIINMTKWHKNGDYFLTW
jgi:hypothetical protein